MRYFAANFINNISYENLSFVFACKEKELKEAGFLDIFTNRCFKEIFNNEGKQIQGEMDVSSGLWHGRVVIVTPEIF